MIEKKIVSVFQSLVNSAEDMISLGCYEDANAVVVAALEFAENAVIGDRISRESYNSLVESTVNVLEQIESGR